MAARKVCYQNKVTRWIRIVLSLLIIAAGIYYRNWFGLFGVIPLISAWRGDCFLNLKFRDVDEDQFKL
jgi:hypothetical protein